MPLLLRDVRRRGAGPGSPRRATLIAIVCGWLAFAFVPAQAETDASARVSTPERLRDDAAAPRVVALAGRVLHVHDGDSFTMRTGDGRERGVRIAGIDAPERTQPFANVSRQSLRARIERRDVHIDVIKTDVFGRLVGLVRVDDRDVGLAQLQAGLAWHFARYDADLTPAERRRYSQAERVARTRRDGLWRDPSPVAPWLFRRQRR